ncbi:MAG: PilZ domain-containing protein [Gammaproteobacteria bacterium]
MTENRQLAYEIKDIIELNLSYMPFITEGGLFIPTDENIPLGEQITITLLLPGKNDPLLIQGKVVWHTPKNALHHVLPGIGIQFIGKEAASIRTEIENNLDKSMEVGGYVYGVTEEKKV